MLLGHAMNYKTIVVCVASVIFTACAGNAPPTYYSWGGYEAQLYSMYNRPEKATPELQIEALEKDIMRAAQSNRPVPPGVYAHLAYQYGLMGNKSKAIELFNMEKRLYPESSTYINTFLKQIS